LFSSDALDSFFEPLPNTDSEEPSGESGLPGANNKTRLSGKEASGAEPQIAAMAATLSSLQERVTAIEIASRRTSKKMCKKKKKKKKNWCFRIFM
jgi:hypothetical protein